MAGYLIKNGIIVDGSGSEPYPGDVVVRDGVIDRIIPSGYCGAEGKGTKWEDHGKTNGNEGALARKIHDGSGSGQDAFCPNDLIVLDAAGAYVTPGFIDIHRHGDWEAFKDKEDEILSRQGLTSVVNGNCGLAAAPAGDIFRKEMDDFLRSVVGEKPSCVSEDLNRSMGTYMEALSKRSRSVNTGMLCGSGMLRAAVRGFGSGELSDEEKHKVWHYLEESLAAGAMGVSLGIGYVPESYYDAKGLIEALAPIRGSHVPVATHIRTEGDGMLDALEEVMQITEALNVPLHVSHLKCIGKRSFGTRPPKVKEMFARGRERGMTIDYDLYPYTMGSTQLVHVLPPEVQEGSAEECIRRLRDPEVRSYITERLSKPAKDFENIIEMDHFENVYAVTLFSEKYRKYQGKSLAEIARLTENDPYETLYDLLAEEKLGTTMEDLVADEDDMLYFLKDEEASLISDAIYPEGGGYHPRVYGCYTHFLEEYVANHPVFTISEAIQKMTSRPAKVYHLNRGLIKEGMAADINVFRLEDIHSHADYLMPERFGEGFMWVMCGGEVVVDHDRFVKKAGGCIIHSETV